MDNMVCVADDPQKIFDKQFELWRSWCSFSPNEPNSIERQLMSLIQNDLQFRVIEKARELGNKTLESLLLRSHLDRAYATAQMIGIRRLIESSKSSKLGVVSLQRLLNDIKQHRNDFTRHNFVCQGGFAYEPPPSSVEDSCDEHGLVLTGSPMETWLRNYDRHTRFDLISGTNPQTRTQSDKPHERLIAEVERLLGDSRIASIQKHVNKFMAHSSDAFSREGIENLGISLELIASVHEILVKAESIFVDFLLFPEQARKETLYSSLTAFSELASGDREKAAQLSREWNRLAEERSIWRYTAQDIKNLIDGTLRALPN